MSRNPVTVPPEVSFLSPFADAGLLGATELHAVATYVRLADDHVPEDVALAAALAVRAPLHGHVCVDLRTVRDTLGLSAGETTELVEETAPSSSDAPDVDARQQALNALEWPSAEGWLDRVAASPLVYVAGSEPPPAHLRPFVVENGLLYLSRFWNLERYVAADLRLRSIDGRAVQLAALDGGDEGRRAKFDLAMDAACLKASELFPDEEDGDTNQRDAVVAAMSRDFVVIAGGPGTGKTHTVARLLAALLAGLESVADGDLLDSVKIALAAPTGKASARMSEAVRQAMQPVEAGDPLPVSEAVQARLASLEASTIHRLLGRGRSGGFRHNAEHPLEHDVVVVDEVSMVSLSLIAHLLAAVKPSAKVVLVGDPYQLASVEAGTVLGDIVGVSGRGGSEPPPPPAIAESVRRLGVPRRFADGSGIKAFADLVRQCDGDGAVALLEAKSHKDLRWIVPDSPEQSTVIDRVNALAVETVSAAKEAVDLGGDEQEAAIAEVLRQMLGVKVLSALRRGSNGVDGWNRRVEDHLRRKGLKRYDDWYTGRPVMVTANDYLNNVFNGDVGVAIRTGSGDRARYQVWFPQTEGLHVVEASRLDRITTQWAMSIHKSQGSEFDDVVVTLPPPPSRILTRELLYTAVTRAKKNVTIVASEAAIRHAVERPVARASGLAARLTGE